jgi:hypothetical protein
VFCVKMVHINSDDNYAAFYGRKHLIWRAGGVLTCDLYI